VRSLKLGLEAAQAVLEDYVRAIEQVEERIRTLEEKLEGVAEQEPYGEKVGWLRCFRGIDTVTAMTILAELHGFVRFDSARKPMGYLGLVPSEHSSGERERRGGITKAGNRHVRRVLVEAAWHYRHAPAVGVALRERRKGQPGEVIALADKAQERLHRRYWRLTVRGNKPHAKAVVAVARELVGFLWAVLRRESAAA
jgi:transposase